jgi:membrane-anchored protein YejM (alkaline phosphatase superfamily)
MPVPLPGKLPRMALLRWLGWFGAVNAGLFLLIGLRYLLAFVWPEGLLATFYVVFAGVSHFALLGTVPLLVLTLPLVILYPGRRLVSGFAILLAAVALTLIVLDTTIFAQYRYHIGALTIVLFETSTWILTGVTFVSILIFETLLAGLLWRRCLRPHSGRPGVWLAAVLVLFWLAGQSIHVWADATSYVQVTKYTRVLPLYYPMTGKRKLIKYGWMDESEIDQLRILNQAKIPESGLLKYPLSPMQCGAEEALPNILFIVVDGMRRDQISAGLTPAMSAFAAQSLDFQNHYSGGNSSRMGFFSMFYGLPSTYWDAFYSSQREPVLMEQIRKHGYELFLSSAVGFGSPHQLDRTVFAGVQTAIPPAGAGADIELNREVTRAWNGWIEHNAGKQPFFSFLYYDPGTKFAPPAELADAEAELDDGARKRAQYGRALQFVDVQIDQVLQALDASGTADNTLVILTSDHGYEFDENGLGYIGHATNFSPWQLVSATMLRWPGKAPQVFSHRTAHQDLPVTLLQELFACSNPARDYASGQNLFAGNSWDWLVAGSYNTHAIVEPDKVVVTYPGGMIEILGEGYRPQEGLSIDAKLTGEVMLEMRRFYQ